jgi:sec-independent protein translocase protein TatC
MRSANPNAFRRVGNRIRRRLLLTFVAFGIGAASTWNWQREIFEFLLIPADGLLSPFGGSPVFTGPTAMMGATIQLSLRGGAVVALPVLVGSVYTLIRPLIPRPLHHFIKLFLPATLLCFLAGASFAYFVMLPAGLGFLLNFGGGVAQPLITINEYLDLMISMTFWLGVVFELPVAMYLLAKTNVISYRKMKNLRKFVPVTAFILSAIITPTFDIFNQTLVAVPIILLYEVGLFWAWVAHPERGNYLWLKTIRAAVLWVARVLRAVVLSPYTVPRLAYRKMVKLVKAGWRKVRR